MRDAVNDKNKGTEKGKKAASIYEKAPWKNDKKHKWKYKFKHSAKEHSYLLPDKKGKCYAHYSTPVWEGDGSEIVRGEGGVDAE